MSVGFLMLCHTALDRAAQVARHWAERGCPVVIHLDRRVAARSHARLATALADLGNIRFCERHACEWGTWGVVGATLSAATVLLRDFPGVRHVYLASGACLPLRPVAELQAYLEARPQTDFIESVTTEDVGWAVGGLDLERFTLHFPFSWRRNRRLFDRYVALQRRLGLRRRIPEGLEPHLGSQWWCLTRRTLEAILQDPQRPALDHYFRKVWIPDECYFQTLVRRHSRQVDSRSLTLAKFDFQGKPHIFYDDHLQLLRRSDCFVARKIWPQAGKLYRSFLREDASDAARAEPNPGKIDRLFSKAVERRTKGRAGLYMQSRHPNFGWENGRTAAAYSVFEGFAELFENFAPWLGKVAGTRVHGHLFAPDRVQFAGGEPVYDGGLSSSAALRDYNPQAFLTSLIWNTRGERQCFQFGPDDRQDIAGFFAADPNAQVSVISGAWAVPLFRSSRPVAEIRKHAAWLQKVESGHLTMLRASWVKARVRVWSLAEFIESPMEPLQTLMDEISPRALRRLTEAPRLVDLTGFDQFLHGLRNEGMKPVLIGDYPARGEAAIARRRQPLLASGS
ncbi:glycosyl transferase [Cereibacter changlensis]|uniref:Peptide O-xylosyltransferase n=1 Tax=Cereibacter changlensis TaxID=402884 RepID=A0A4U0Z6Z8_9RHOB|nr:beta-1,6-N-acetylglucosaminyltransferase [Cereibacter changlensis]TKA97313.1 glycosyl transferase [Cereibacter changlensis]